MSRAELRRAAGILQAISASFSGNIGPEFFHALSESSDEAVAEYNRFKAQRDSQSNGHHMQLPEGFG